MSFEVTKDENDLISFGIVGEGDGYAMMVHMVAIAAALIIHLAHAEAQAEDSYNYIDPAAPINDEINRVPHDQPASKKSFIKLGLLEKLRSRQDIASVLGNVDVLSMARLAGFVTVSYFYICSSLL